MQQIDTIQKHEFKPTTANIKRRAKRLKKESDGQITHTQALEVVARESGFENWKHALRILGEVSK
jgi:hypothetical protein